MDLDPEQGRGRLPLLDRGRGGRPDQVEERPADPVLPRARLRAAVRASAGLLLLQLGWVLVLPPATGIDEFDHVLRASAVSLGHWQPGDREVLPSFLARGGMLPVRADVAEAAGPACARLPYTQPFNCRPYRDLGGGVVEIASGVDPYNPTFYAVAGELSRPFRGNAAIYAMRGVSILASVLMFGLAVLLTTGWARTRWPVVLLLVACLPTTVYSTAVAAPNGPQMMSGILVWAALIALVRAGPATRGLAYPALMGGVAVIANTHTLGLLWLGLTVLSVVALHGVRSVVSVLLPRRPREWAALAVGVAAVAFQLWWMVYARPNVSTPEGGLPGNPWGPIADGAVLWPLQAIAAFPYRNESAPGVVYGVAAVILVALTVVTVRALRHRPRLAVTTGLVLLLSAAAPIAITYAGFHRFGMSWQGRYGMPFSAGLFVLAGIALDGRRPAARGALLWLGLAGWGLAQTVSLLGVRAKQVEDHHLVAATGWWAPPVLLILVVGVGATLWWMRALQPLGSAAEPSVRDDAPPVRTGQRSP